MPILKLGKKPNKIFSMKIGIITHPLFHNYGGTLQAFAMQEILRRLGHDPITIDYLPNSMSRGRYCLAQIKTLIYKLTFRHSRKFFSYPKRIRRSNFQKFMDKYMCLTETVHKYRVGILRKYKIDAIIVGSDQVWRGQYHSPSEQPDLFLKFAKNYHVPKVAYAASFGVNTWEYSDKLTKECAKYAKLFRAISTREDSGVTLCKEYLHVEAIGVSDPTLLLDKEDYEKICSDIPIHKDAYLLAYLLDMTEDQEKKIRDFAIRNNLHVKFCTAERDILFSIEEWLALFRDASFVITNSFHGTVFSIINNKNFYTIVNESRGADRFVSMLSRFKLEDHLFQDIKYMPSGIVSVDWDAVNQLKEEWKNASVLFLKNNLV